MFEFAFLIFALFLAMVIQPNLNKQIKEKSKIDVPEQTNSTIITNDTVDNSRCKSKAVIGSLTLAHSQNSQMSFMYGFFFVKFLFFTVVCVVIVI